MSSKRDEIITSESADRLLNYILPLYDNDKYILSIFEAKGIEFDNLQEIINQFYDQAFPQRATWSLFYWEQLFNLNVNVGEPYEERRKRLISFLGSGKPVTRNRLENQLSSLSGVNVNIVENLSPYTFRVILENCTDGDYIALVRALEELKPAHLSYTIMPRIIEKFRFVEKVYVNLRRYHTVREFRVGMTFMKEQNEVMI